jgi:DNA-binding NtrC family response regulator
VRRDIVRLMVLDDNPDQVRAVLGGAVAQYGSDSDVSYSPPWHFTLGEDIEVELQLDVPRMEELSSPQRAAAFLLDPKAVQGYDMILVDLDWEQRGGDYRHGLVMLEQMAAAKVRHPFVAMYTLHEISPDYVMRALAANVKAVIRKTEPVHLLNVFVSASEFTRLRRVTVGAQRALTSIDNRLSSESPAMQSCLAEAAVFASNPRLPILLTGPTGSGKEILARAIHLASPRARRAFEFVDCAALTNLDLARSELFGHERGAYTGAQTARQGLFEVANGGTLLLDEVHALPIEIHPLLHRVIETGEYRRLGGQQVLRSDVRLLSATSQDLDRMLAAGEFTPDLYNRLAGCRIQVPGLNDRTDDIPGLTDYFLRTFAEAMQRPPITATPQALKALMRYKWRYNIRELKWTLERSATRLAGTVLDEPDLHFEGDDAAPAAEVAAWEHKDLSRLVRLRPREGNQQIIFDRLIQRCPDLVSYHELHEAIGLAEESSQKASNLLTTKVGQLRRKLEPFGYSIANEEGQGYRLTVAHAVEYAR